MADLSTWYGIVIYWHTKPKVFMKDEHLFISRGTTGMSKQLNLIIQYCNATDPLRQQEYDFCVQQNLANPQIGVVLNLVEKQTTVPPAIAQHPKYRECVIDSWLTYQEAFRMANEILGAGQTCCLANLDIFLDRDSKWQEAAAMVAGDDRIVLCQSRHEFDGVGQVRFDPGLVQAGMANSQDAWIFRTPLAVYNCDFQLGIPGCDNAIAHRFKQSGYVPVNAPGRFKIFHFDLCRKSGEEKERWKHQRSQALHHHPEQQGQFLVPAMELVPSLDRLLEQLKVTPLQKYEIACDIVSRFVKVRHE